MRNENGKPLIRKQYTLPAILKMIFSKFSNRKSGVDLHIPGFARTVEFRSVGSQRKPVPGPARADETGPGLEEILSKMKDNKLRGFGGAGFPMAEKLQSVLDSGNADPVLIINGVECDPGLYHDKWILENKQPELEQIVRILRSAIGLSNVYLAKKPGTVPVEIDGVIGVDVPDTYPAGEEHRLVSWILGVDCKEDGYPAERGIWVQNIQSLIVLNSALRGESQRRYITMTDLDRKHAVVVECDPDASIQTLSDRIFGEHDGLYLGGGIMQGYAANGTKTLNHGINLIATGKAAEFMEAECRHCGQCTRHCAAGLEVDELVSLINGGGAVPEDVRKACHRCGTCSYVCPAGKDVCSLIASA